MRTITRTQLVDFLLGIVGATFATLTLDTDARARKRGNPFGIIRKRQTINGQLNFFYDIAVRRRLQVEGRPAWAFVQGPSWHRPVKRPSGTLTPLACHKEDPTRLYVRFRLLAEIVSPTYFDTAGHALTLEQVLPFLPPQSTYVNQGLASPIIFKTIGLESVKTIKTEGLAFTIEGD